MIKRLLSLLMLAGLVAPALAQQAQPFTYPQTIGTSSVTILPANPARKKLVFHNPNDTAKIAVCPVGPTRAVGGSASLIVAAINGAGCVTILPYDRWEVSGSIASSAAQIVIPSAWVGIASAGGSQITILDRKSVV